MIRLKACALPVLALMCFSLLPFSQCYLDVATDQGIRELSQPSSKENIFTHALRHREHHSHYNVDNADYLKNKTKKDISPNEDSNSIKPYRTIFRHHHRANIITTASPVRYKSEHHLRHRNRYHESSKNRIFPSPGKQYLEIATPENVSAIKPDENDTNDRLLDKNSVVFKTKTTSGPKSRHNYGSHTLSATSIDKQNSDDIRFDNLNRNTKKSFSKEHAGIPEPSEEEYVYSNDEDYMYETSEEEESEEVAPNNRGWNDIELMDQQARREHRSSANIWMSNDEIENVYSRYNLPGKITQYKFEELGTHEAIKQSRKNHIINHMQHKAMANAHAAKIYTDANCHLPQQRIERIQKDPSKIYVPHCTILYRCGDDTGCCKTDRQTCAPKKTQSIDLYFFVKSFNAKQGSIEKHTFINHTECHCVDKTKYHLHALHEPDQIMRKATVLDCNCPKLFEKILQENGLCRCDCSSGNIGCNYLKRGMEHFSMVDRKCIIEGRCKPPTCEFGVYLKKHGRCQRNNEIMQTSGISWSYN